MNGPRIPSLDVSPTVINIGREDMAGLTTALLHDADYYEARGEGQSAQQQRKRIRTILKPARTLRTEVIVHRELLNLQEHSGFGQAYEEHIDELIEYMQGVMTAAGTDVVKTPTLPTKVERLGRRGRLLTIAGNQEMLQERALAKAALANFYRLRTVPENVWFDDEVVTRPWLARSEGWTAGRLLTGLADILEHTPDLLPEYTEIGPVRVEPNPPR